MRAPELAATQTTITTGANPDYLNVDGSKIYVHNTGDRTISVIDNETNVEIAESAPLPLQYSGSMVLSPDGTKIYVFGQDQQTYRTVVLDAETLEPIRTVDSGFSTDGGLYVDGTIATSADGRYLYVPMTFGRGGEGRRHHRRRHDRRHCPRQSNVVLLRRQRDAQSAWRCLFRRIPRV